MKLKVPGESSQITLSQFMAYHNAADDVERVMVIIDKSREYCEGLKADSARTIIDLFDEVVETSPTKFERLINVNGKRLGFLPDINSMTFREHVDLDQLAQTIWIEGKPCNYTELPRLMAVMFRPVTEQVGEYYNIEKYDLDKTARYMPEIMALTLDRVNGALLFFSSIGAELANNSLVYLDSILKREMNSIIPPRDSAAGGGFTSSKA
jgi:hypothetical protein